MGEEDFPEEYEMSYTSSFHYDAPHDRAIAAIHERVNELLRERGGSRIQVRASGGEVRRETLAEKLDRERNDLEQAIGALSAQLAKRTAQLAELARYPEDDPYADDTVLRFKKTFPTDPSKAYQYTASRIDGLWYVTGARSPDGVSWADLIAWMGLGVTEIYKISPGRAAKVNW